MIFRPGSLLLLILAPILEIYILVKVGGYLGGTTTIFLVVFTSVLGYLLIKHQSSNALANVQQAMMRGELPQLSMIEATVVMIGGILLMIPGFITDLMGLMTLIPALRRKMATQMLNQAMQRASHMYANAEVNIEVETEQSNNDSNDSNTVTHEKSDDKSRTIEGEYKRED